MAQLLRTLRLRDVVLLIIGAIIGSGIFLVPGAILREVNHSLGTASLVWIAGGLLSLLGAVTYAELAAMKPDTGGLYVYVRDGFGPLAAFLYGWTLFLAIASGTIASLAVAFSTYLNEIVPLSGPSQKLIAIAMIAVITAVNVWGTRQSSDMQNWSTAAKVLLILVLCGILLALGRGYSAIPQALWTEPVSGSLLSRFGLAMIAVLWAYEGWQFVTYSAGEVIDPQKNFPRALTWGVLLMAGLYLITNLGYVAALGPARAAESDAIAATSIAFVLGPSAAKLVAFTILISVFSATNTVSLTAPRVFYAMAEDRLFFRQLAAVHPRFRTPAVAIIALGVWSAVMSVMGGFQQLISYTMFMAWIFYGLAAASIFVYRRKFPGLARPYHVPGYPWTPLIFVIASAALVLNVIVSNPKSAGIGLALIALGLPAYFGWASRREPQGAEGASTEPSAEA